MTTFPTPASDREIAGTRILRAPRALVFEAFTTPEHLARWWGPNGFTTTTKSMAFEPGGVWRFTMHGPDGTDYPNVITFLEIVRPEKIVYKHGGDADAEPVNFTTTITLEDLGRETRATWRMVFPSAQAKRFVVEKYGAADGLQQTLDRLVAYAEARAVAGSTH
jgi:uncharacterized protein YndB with AHSA1/START domain